MAAEVEFVPRVQAADLPGHIAAGDVHRGAVLVGMDREADTGLDADHLVQVEVVELLALVGHGQDGHVGMVAQPYLRLAHQHGALAALKLLDLAALGLLGQIASPDPFRFDGSVGLKES